MKICVAQTRPVKGDIAKNIENHKRLIGLAVSQGADLIVFPELSITGYEPELAEELATQPDDSRFDDFPQIADAHRITIGVGVPLRNGAGITISMALFQPGQTRQVYSKKYIHADEEPFFIPGQNTIGLLGGDAKIALAICYELSVPEHAEEASQRGAKIYIASAVKTASQVEKARERLGEIARRYSMTVFLSNCIGLSGGYVCGGKSAIWDSNGELLGELNDADEGILMMDTETRAITVKTI